MESASLLACGVITGLGAVVNTAKVPSGSSVVVIGTGGVGLNSTINVAQEDALAKVHELTAGRGADYVFVTVGSGRAMAQGLEMIRTAGTLVLVGMPASGVKLEIEAANFAGDSQQILGSKMGSTRLRVDIPKLVELYEEGRLKLDELVTNCYSLEEINEAIDAVNRGEALRNVIVL